MSFNEREGNQHIPPVQESIQQQTWDALLQKIARFKENPIENRLGSELDEGIEPMLVALWANGFETSSSCFGHVHAEYDARTGNRVFLPFVMLSNGRYEDGVEPYRALEVKENKKDKIFRDIDALVKEFNEGREAKGYSNLLAIRRGFGYALDDVFLGTVGTLDHTVQRLEKEDLESVLQSAQSEFDAFAEFLKQRFFQENP